MLNDKDLYNDLTNDTKTISTELSNSIEATDEKAQYDGCAKRILGQKSILAHILVKTVDEFADMSPKEVERLIEGEPYISKVPVEPGLTNAADNGSRIVGLNTESQEVNEGLIRYDIIFYVRKRNGLSQIIINVEAQKDDPKEHDILNRAVFYICRLISSQKERDFKNTNYDDIKQVYSIWVCLNMQENCMSHYHMVKDDVIGAHSWKGKQDLLNIVMIGLAKELPEHDDTYKLHRLLGALFSNELKVNEKLNIVGTEYDIPLKENLRKDVSFMCNLGQGIEDRGIEKGLAAGRVEGRAEERAEIILNLRRNGFTVEQIASVTNISLDNVKVILEKEPALA